MPSGKTHDIITDRTTGPIALLTFYASKQLMDYGIVPSDKFSKITTIVSEKPLLGFLATAGTIYVAGKFLTKTIAGEKPNFLSKTIKLLYSIGILLAFILIFFGDGVSRLAELTPSVGFGIYIGLIVSICYFFAGRMFSGDLDLTSRQTRRWGMFKFIWKPYQKMFSHRSKWTHGVFRGTIVRVLYLGLWLSPLLFIIPYLIDVTTNQILDGITNSFSLMPMAYIAAFIGLLLGSASHSIADWTVSRLNKII